MPVTKISDNMGGIQKAVAALLKSHVVVGIPDSTAERKPEDGEKSTASNAQIGYAMEYGEPDKNVPARSFLIPGCDDAKLVVTDRLLKAGLAALTGDVSAVEKGLTAVGIVAASAVKAKITDGPFAPLSERTIQARAARGRRGAKQFLKLRAQGTPEDVLNEVGLVKPLIDTGQLRRSITSIVRTK